jgi:hypothetical protein
MTALKVLSERQTPSLLEDGIISLGYFLPALFAAVTAAAGPIEALMDHLSERQQVFVQSLFFGLAFVAVLADRFFDLPLVVALGALGIGLFLVSSLVPFGTYVRDWRRSRRESHRD